ncbi:hypothetical protein GCM10011391_03260 [Pullulanibacillus camelliae]|uniref:HTH merR-type domain-containing protein n=1 Tax=Pullulanibacillus camelliae TaxID=1707096 RepID=A0A8J2VIV9_9BACL|nr:MerR family transcriptional regulator [Pullulanibacillus camelliae]GGE28094.1 hypothetical protein GCM10011391_03260 [Pullulanibacillus camelliae]
MENKMTINTFAELCNTTKATLRWYRSKGLLQPAEIGTNGYSYYTIEQIVDFNLIQSLKGIGYSLEQIKKYMNTEDVDESYMSLDQQVAKISQQIDELQQRKDFLTTLISNQNSLFIQWGEKPQDGDYHIRYCKEESYIIMPAPTTSSIDYLDSLKSFQQLCQQLGLGNNIPIIAFFSKESLIKKDFRDGYNIGTRVYNPETTSDILTTLKPNSDLNIKIITRKPGKYFTYLTTLLLEKSDVKYKGNPMIAAQKSGLEKAIQNGANLEMGMMETVIFSTRQSSGKTKLYLEISLFCS